MAYIILPSRRTRQPQTIARLNPAFVGPNDFVFNAATPRINLASGKPISISYAVDNPFPVTRYGIGYQPIDDQFDGIQVVQGASFYGGPGFTFATAVQGALFGNHLLADVGVGGVCGYSITFADGAYAPDGRGIPKIGVTFYGVAGYASSYVSTPADGLCFVVTGRTGRIAIFVNGTLLETISAGTYIPNNGYSAKYGAAHESINAFRGAASHYFALDRELPDAVAAELSINPWQLFAPDSRRIYFGASGGGATIFESTFADSWSLSDTYSASATLVSTYTDSPTVTDSSSSSAVFASAFDETIPVSDGPSADMGGVANRTQEESFTITDAYSASMVANATISETLSAEASASAAAIFNAIFAETLPIVDGEEADAGRISDIAENVTVTDAYTAGIVAQATQAESVTTIDTYDTIAIYNPLLAETLPITDTVGATLTVPTSGTVDLSQESIDSLAHEIMVQLTSTPVRKL